jgi:hypothetical protein
MVSDTLPVPLTRSVVPTTLVAGVNVNEQEPDGIEKAAI